MTGNRVPDPPAQAGENQDKPLAMPSKPPPPPVRRKSGPPPPFPPTPVRTASPPPAPARAVLSQPPPPPKRSKSPLPSPSVMPVRAFPGAGASKPPPPPSSRKQPSAAPPLPVQAAPVVAPVSVTEPLAVPAVMGLPPWAAPQAAIVESEILPVEQHVAFVPPAPAVETAPIAAAPTVVEAAPAVVEAAPAVVEAAPAVVEAAPAVVEAAPAVVEAAPAVVEAAPAVVEAAPAIVEAAPAVVEAAPAVVEAAPAFVGAASATPAEEAPASVEVAPASAGEPAPAAEASAELQTAPETAAEEPASVLDAAPSTQPESMHEATTPEVPAAEAAVSEELDSSSDNEPTHVLDATTLRAQLAESELAHEQKRQEEADQEAPASAESSSEAEAATEAHGSSPEAEGETLPLAVEQALALEHALDGAPAIDPEPAKPVKPARDFSSIGSEMPVVLSTPAATRAEGAAAALLDAGRTWLPEASAWSRKKLRATPRALVIGAPFVALFGIWAAHSVVKRSHHDAPVVSAAVEATTVEATAATTPPTVASPASTVTPPPVPATVAAVEAAPSPSAASADPAELKAAKTHGLPALEALAAKYPADIQVGIALASQQAHAQRFEAAVGTVDQLLAASPSSAQNGKVMGILWRAAQSPASEQTFSSLRKLGARGSDVVFDLAATPGVRDTVRERARGELASHLADDANTDTRVASALLLAADCGARKSLLERAEHEGGKRTRGLLERYAQGGGCASSSDHSCSACLAGSPELSQALTKLSAGAKP